MYNISIIIPHYNSPNSLKTLLESIGFHKDVEVIVIDDHSNKEIDVYKKCKEMYYGREGFIFLENDPDKKGAGSARNVGVKIARGKWLLFADADDTFIESMYDSISRCFDDQSDIIYFPPYIDESKEIRDVVKLYRKICSAYIIGIEGAETLLRYQFIVPWSKMIRNSLVQENHIVFDDVMYSNDVLFSVKCGNAARKIRVFPEPIYYSASTDGSLIRTKNEESFFVRAEVNCRYFSYINKNATKVQKQYLSSFALLRTRFRILKNGYGIKGVKKYSKMLKENELTGFKTLYNPVKTYLIKKKINSVRHNNTIF